MSTAPQLRMHAGASDTHIPRPLLGRAADEIDALKAQNAELVEALEELVTRCDGAEGVRSDGSNIQTMRASAILAKVE